MTAPKAIIETLATLREERVPLAARLDAIDLAMENLSRVYGINGTPQPLPLTAPKRAKATKEADTSEAAARRETLLTLITKAPVGLTVGELRKATPKMDGKDRSNALQVLKAAKQIRRQGNTWQAA